MGLDYKKIGLMAVIVGAAVALGFIIYFMFLKPSTPTIPAGSQGTTTPSGFLPAGSSTGPTTGFDGGQAFPTSSSPTTPSGNDGLTETEPIITTKALTTKPAYFPVASGNGLLYYDYQEGKFYRLAPDGTATVYNDKVFHNVSNVVWANSQEKAVLQYPDGSNIIYDFKQDKQYTLPKHWTDFEFSANDTQIAFKSLALDPENRYLAVGDGTGSNLKIVEAIGGSENKFHINWSPNGSMVGQFIESKDLDRMEVYFIGLNNENFKSMIVQGRDFQGLWAPDGNSMVYSTYNTSSYQPQLWISGANAENVGANRNLLGLNTWADKCVFANQSEMYCAVPQYLPYGAGLQRDLARGIPDDIYRVDLATGAKTYLATPQGSHNIGSIFPSAGGKYLLFSDTGDGQIYRIDL